MLRGPSALIANASGIAFPAPSTALYAAQLNTTSGRASAIAASTAAASVIETCSCVSPAASPSRRTSSAPSWPPAPKTTAFKSGSRRNQGEACDFVGWSERCFAGRRLGLLGVIPRQQRRHLRLVGRPSDQESLRGIASCLDQHRLRHPVLQAFRDHAQTEVVAEADSRAD